MVRGHLTDCGLQLQTGQAFFLVYTLFSQAQVNTIIEGLKLDAQFPVGGGDWWF